MPISNVLLLVLGVVTAFGGLLFAIRSKNPRAVLGGLSLADLGYLILGMGVGGSSGMTATLLLVLFNGCARLLAFTSLSSLLHYDKMRANARLLGIGKAKPLTGLLYSLSMFAALGISPFFTLEAKPFVLGALMQTGQWIFPLCLVIANCVSVVVTLRAVHFIWMRGPYTYAPRQSWKDELFDGALLSAGLGLILAFLGIFGHSIIELVMGWSGGRSPFFDTFAVTWHPAVSLLYIGAFVTGCVGFVASKLRNILAVALPALALVIVFGDTSLAPLSRFFAIIVLGVAFLISLYSWGYMEKALLNNAYYCLLLLMFGSLGGIALSDNFGSFFVFWELMTLSSYVLVAWENTEQAHAAAKKYFIMCSVAAALMLPGFLLLWVEGGSLHMQTLAQGAVSSFSSASIVLLIAVLVLIGCGVKAGLFPGHSWLPDAHPAAPSSISGPLSGVLTKSGIFGLVQIIFVIFGVQLLGVGQGSGGEGLPTFGWMLCGVGLLTMIYGEYMALKQEDIKRLLAYSTMGQLGEICMTLGLMTWLAATGVLMHVVNHAIMKDLLFLCSGALIMRAGTRNLKDLAGLGKAMPFTATCMVIGLLSILGLPPFAGFMSKFLMLYALADQYPVLAAMMLTASMAGCVYYTRIIKTLLFEPYSGPVIEEAPVTMRVAMGVLAGLCLLLGFFPQLSLSYLVEPVLMGLHEQSKLFVGLVPSLTVSWPLHTLLLLAGSLVPVLLRKDSQKAGKISAVLLGFAALLIVMKAGSLDLLSLGFALFIAVIGCVNMVYSVGYMEHSHTQWRFYAFFLCMTAGLTGVATSQDIFSFFVFWEIMSSWSLYFVIVHEENPVALREGFKYFFFNVLGAAFLFLGVVLVINWSGGGQFSVISEALPQFSNGQKALFLLLMTIGFVMKAAQLPFRIDIQMHPASAPTPVSGYISSVLLKSALFGLVKLFIVLGGGVLFVDAASGNMAQIMYMTVWIGGITIVMAGAYAVIQDDIKLVLIYSTVSQLGYMVVGIALGTSLGVAGGLLHLVNHIFFKDLLFLVAGAVIVQTSRQSMSSMGGLGKHMPKTLALFCIGAICVIGLPPSSGFTSKWILYHALMEEGYVLVAFLSLVGSVLTLAYIAKMLHSVFLGQPSKGLENVKEVPEIMITPMVILAGGCVVTSLFPGLILMPLNSVLQEYGMATLDVGLGGINSGVGAWNATLTSFLMAVVFIGSMWALQRLSGKRRITDIHICGIAPEDLQSRTSTTDIYSAPLSLIKRLMRTRGKRTQDGV